MANTLIRIGTVASIEGDIASENETDGLRVKVRLPQDGAKNMNDIEWAFPLLPKMFQTAPQIGEAALVIIAEVDNTQSQRFYISPIISQPQFMEYCDSDDGTSLLQGANKTPIGKISNNDATTGAFPSISDVGLIGRGQEDIRLKYDAATEDSEVDITAGIRVKAQNVDNPDIRGNVIFNIDDPAYVQVKHACNISSSGNSFVNVVADKINLMSHNDNEINGNLVDNQNLVNESNFDKVMSKLHPAVKGDKLLELLILMIGAIKNHVHPWAGMEQCGDWKGYINELNKFDVNSILSDDVRLS